MTKGGLWRTMTVHLDAAWRRSCANKRDQPAGAPFGRLTNEEKKETDATLVAAVGIAPVHADGAENKKGNLCPFARADGGLLSGDSGRVAAAASARGEYARAAELY